MVTVKRSYASPIMCKVSLTRAPASFSLYALYSTLASYVQCHPLCCNVAGQADHQGPQDGKHNLQPADGVQASSCNVNSPQDKLATKVRKKENTIRNLTTECERIRAKQATEELTAGQASTLARNARTIDLLKEEVS